MDPVFPFLRRLSRGALGVSTSGISRFLLFEVGGFSTLTLQSLYPTFWGVSLVTPRRGHFPFPVKDVARLRPFGHVFSFEDRSMVIVASATVSGCVWRAAAFNICASIAIFEIQSIQHCWFLTIWVRAPLIHKSWQPNKLTSPRKARRRGSRQWRSMQEYRNRRPTRVRRQGI